MYNRNNKKTVLNSVHLPPLKVFQKSSMLSIRSRRFDLLPVIQEEEGNNVDEIELNNYLFEKNSLANKPSVKKLFANSAKKSEEILRIRNSMKLPPLSNINCMMNMDMKQSHSLWDNSFSRKLINGRNIKDTIKSPRANEKISLFTTKSFSQKNLGDSRSLTNDKLNQNRTIGDKGKQASTINQQKKTRKRRSKTVTTKKNTFVEESPTKSVSDISIGKVGDPKPSVLNNFLKENPTDFQVPEINQRVSFNKSQRFLSECVKSILDCNSTEVTCEKCNEKFLDYSLLNEHKRNHEEEKQECLLCGEIFFSGNDFVQHLLSHEGVDKFSCKKCKKYFPSLKTYRVHCQKVHLIPSANPNTSEQRVKHVKEWLPKFECMRCEAKYNTEEALESHKKVHARQDLIGAYLLNSQGIVR